MSVLNSRKRQRSRHPRKISMSRTGYLNNLLTREQVTCFRLKYPCQTFHRLIPFATK